MGPTLNSQEKLLTEDEKKAEILSSYFACLHKKLNCNQTPHTDYLNKERDKQRMR